MGLVVEEVERCGAAVEEPGLRQAFRTAREAVKRSAAWLGETGGAEGREALEAGARRFALTLGRALELALLARHAQWSLDHEEDARTRAAARRLAAHGVDRLAEADPEDARALANDEALAAQELPAG